MRAYWLLPILIAALILPAMGQQKKAPSESKLQSDLKRLQRERSQARSQLSKTRSAAKAVKGDIQAVDARYTEVSSKLEQTTSRLAESRREQARLAKELENATKKLAEKQEEVRERLRKMYMEGEGSTFAHLASSGSLGELSERKYVFEKIALRDRELFDEFKRLRAQVAGQKQNADLLVRRINSLVQDQKRQQSDLEETRHEKKQILVNLQGKQEQLERIIAALDAEQREVQARIEAYRRARAGKPTLPAFTGRLGRPINAPITSGFGMRFHPILKINRMHNGIDFGAKSGTPIYAAADGIVVAATYSKGYGNMIILDHGGDLTTLYAHCSRLLVGEGAKVTRGQQIATVGSTGLSTGPHLHFEVRVGGRAVNPMGRF